MKRTLLVLHGALGSWGTFHNILEEIRDDFRVHVMDFDGHGYAPEAEKPFSISMFAENALEYLENRALNGVDILGYSMGGYVGLYLAHFYPHRIGNIYTLGTKFDWTPESAAAQAKMLNPDKMEEKIPDFVEDLKARILGKDWRTLVTKTADMMLAMGEKPPLTEKMLSGLNHSVRITRGDKDNMVTEAESRHAANLLPNGAYHEHADTPHPILQVDAKVIGDDLKSWIYG